jgi:PST family polysaccharide transporter
VSIKGKMLASSLWSIVGTAVTMSSSFIVFALMARLIRPVDFGLVAFAAIFVEISRVLMSGGFPEALIQRREWNETAASTAFWMNILGSVVLAALIAGSGAPLAYMFGSATLAEVILAISVSLVIDAVRDVHQAKLRREFGYRTLALRAVLASVISGVVGVALALAGFGVWALVANRLVFSALQTVVILLTVSWRPRLAFSRSECRALLGFGINVVGAGLLAQLNARVAELVVGLVLGPAPLAFYRVGSRALSFLHSLAVSPVQTTALSAFSRLNDAPAIGRAYLRMTRATALVSFPVFLGAAAVAPDFVVVCFGRQWEASGHIMSALALVVTPSTLLYYAPPALTALGRTRLVLVSNLAISVLNALVAIATVAFGPLAVAAGTTARAHLTVPFALKMLQRGIGLPLGTLFRSILEPASAAALMAVAVVAIRFFVVEDFAPLARLALCIAAGAIIYGALLLTLARGHTIEALLELAPHLPPAMRRPAERIIAMLRGTGGRGQPISPA